MVFLLRTVMIALCLCGISMYAQQEEQPTEERIQELTEIAKQIVTVMPTRKTPIRPRDAIKLKKLQDQVDPSEFALVWGLYDEIVRAQAEDKEKEKEKEKEKSTAEDKLKVNKSDTSFKPEPMEELYVLGNPFSGIPINPSEFNVGDIWYMRSIRKKANDLYEKENYSEAYPLLLQLAKRGFKDSQSRLAYILFHGTDGVPKSNYRALGWLGAAANGRTEPIFRVLLNKHLREIPPEQRETVDKVIAGYQAEFGYADQIKCSTNHRYTNGRVKRVFCEFRLEKIANACGFCRAHKVNVRNGS